MSLITVGSTLQTQLCASADGTHTYSITKTLENAVGDSAIVVLLYPTMTGEKINCCDTTITHLVSHMQDMGLKEITIINLFSKVVRAKLSAKGLTVDEENMSYIESEIFSKKDISKKKLVIAWGSSMQTCEACNQSKERIIMMYKKYCPNSMIYQLSSNGMGDEICPHPLYMGIRCKNANWYLTECLTLPEHKEQKKTETKQIKKPIERRAKGREIVVFK